MLTLPRAKFAEFRRNRSGMAATEMAFIAPIMILLALGGVDTTRYVIATEQIDKVASTIGQMLTETQPTIPGGRTAAVTYVDLQFFHDSAMVIFPDVLSDAANQGISWTKDIEISMSSIQFTASPSTCTTNCTYTAQAVWAGGDNPRPCNSTFAKVVDASVPSPTTLPQDVFGPGSIVVVDVQYTYHPWFASYFGVAPTIARSVYFAPRYVPVIKYQTISGDNGIAAMCPGQAS
jgi:hypothetical protein